MTQHQQRTPSPRLRKATVPRIDNATRAKDARSGSGARRPSDHRGGDAATAIRWRATAWLTAVSMLSVVLLVANYLVAVHTTRGRLLDGASFRGAGHAPSRVTKALERLLDIVSASSLLAAIGVIALIALLRLRRDLAAAAVALILGSNLTSQVLKQWVFSRPDLGIYETTPATLNSMPSGHSTVAFSVAVALVLVLPPAVRPLAAAGGVVYASLSALATLSAGWHRPSDSLAAFLVVAAWAGAAEALVIVRRQRVAARTATTPGERRAAFDHGATARRLAMIGGYLLAFGTLIVTIVMSTGLDPYDGAAQVLTYAAGGGLIIGTAAVLMAALVGPLAGIGPAPVPTSRMPRVGSAPE